MGIDWEEILDVEGADMAEVYNENIPEEDSKYYGQQQKIIIQDQGILLGHIFIA